MFYFAFKVYLPNGYSCRTVTQYGDTLSSNLCPEGTRWLLQTVEGNFAGMIQEWAARYVDKLSNKAVLNETVWSPAVRQVEWLKKKVSANFAHSVLQKGFSV